ncbi:MAG: ATP-binding protein [Anaerolineae bacterium]|nr:ATP-binding protein [Anaerolineae bacterium]MCX8067097.1 ATP-binding protein [Anaerolineae bacterium]
MSGERVLIVDDSKEVLEILRFLILEPRGYRVLEATNGVDGLRLALTERPDLLILDEQMPGMNGLDVIRALQEQNAQIPTILMTAFGSEELVVRAFRMGVRDYVIKPFEPEEMLKAVERALAEIRLRAERDRLITQLEEANRRLQQQVQELNTLYSIGRSVTSRLDLETVLTRVVEAAVFLTRAEEGLLLLLDPESGDLVLRAAKNVDTKRAQEMRIRLQDTLAEQVLRSGEPLLIGEGQIKVVTGYLVYSLIYAPLRTPERGTFGILGVTHRTKARSFTTHDVRLLCALADYAAIALENARLYEETETARRKLEAVLRETDEAVIILDPQQRILLCNPAASAALRISSTDVVGRPAAQVISNRTLLDLFLNVARRKQSLYAEVLLAGGRTYNAHLTPVESVGYVLMMQDITHLKELDRVKSEFLATVSHDLRTPLTAIRGYVDLLEKVGPLNEQQREFVDRVRRSIAHIAALIGDLLELGRIEADYDLEMEPLHLESVIDAVVESFRPLLEEKKLTLYWEPKPLPLIRGNPRRLRQVMENLLSNAVKYNREGGWIAVSADQQDGYIIVRVADSGIGISPEDLPHIFERFYRGQGPEVEEIEGTGLGLAIVKSVIEKHGGRIWVESQPGKGSVFTFLLHTMEDNPPLFRPLNTAPGE